MIRLPPRSTRTDTLFPYTTLFRSAWSWSGGLLAVGCVTAVLAMLAGMVELTRVPEGAALRDTWWHMGLMLTATSLFATRLLLRRSEEHTSELQSLMRISYAVFCLKKKKKTKTHNKCKRITQS